MPVKPKNGSRNLAADKPSFDYLLKLENLAERCGVTQGTMELLLTQEPPLESEAITRIAKLCKAEAENQDTLENHLEGIGGEMIGNANMDLSLWLLPGGKLAKIEDGSVEILSIVESVACFRKLMAGD